jgi:zinc transport system permease protein
MMPLWGAIMGFIPFEWAHYGFMQNALLAVLLVTPILALLGCLVVNNQMAFLSEAMGHSTLTGLAIGVLLGLREPMAAIIGFAVLLGILMYLMRRYSAVPPDTAIALVMAFVVSLGIVLLSRGGGFTRFSRYLIGDILTISPMELLCLAGLLVLVLLIWFFFFNALFFVHLNRPLAASRGFPVRRIELFFTILVAVVVAVSMPWVGLLVINSMLILPAATARNLARNTRQYVLLAVALGILSGLLGLVSSFYWDTATGATIVLWACGFFAVSAVFRRR